MSTVALAAFPFALCIGFAVAVIRTFGSTLPPADPAPTERQARIDAAIATEQHPGRRTALTMIRNDEEKQS
ncbi:MAG: hypothetical protein HOZ81_20120 [Streptomyces sp.]|nr:hypothetical protein [Streptomyces sp.]NUS81848.1 hypothetical protein [Streptomyces sp.]